MKTLGALTVVALMACLFGWLATLPSGSTNAPEESVSDRIRRIAPGEAGLPRPQRSQSEPILLSEDDEPARSTEIVDAPVARESAVDPHANISLYGRVLDSQTMKPIADASVSVINSETKALGASVATTAANGSYATDGFAPGMWTFYVSAAEHRSEARTIRFAAEHERHQINFLLQPNDTLAVHTVFVRPPPGVDEDVRTALENRQERDKEQEMLQIALVVSQHPLADGWTDADGRVIATLGRRTGRMPSIPHFSTFEPMLDLPDPRPLVLNACLGRQVLDSRKVSPADQGVTFEIEFHRLSFPRADVRVTAIDAMNGTAIASAIGTLGIDRSKDPLVGNTDSYGSIRFNDVICGPRELVIEAPGYEPLHEEVVIQTSPETSLGTRKLSPATWISGLVIGDGWPRDSVFVRARSLAGFDADPFAAGPALSRVGRMEPFASSPRRTASSSFGRSTARGRDRR